MWLGWLTWAVNSVKDLEFYPESIGKSLDVFSQRPTRSNLHCGLFTLAAGWGPVLKLKRHVKVALGRLWWFRPVRCSLVYLFPSVTLAEDQLLFLHSRCAFCVTYYYYLQWEMWSVAQSYPTLWGPMDCSLPDSSAHGIAQGRIPEWGAIFYCKESSQPRGGTCVSCIGRRILYH